MEELIRYCLSLSKRCGRKRVLIHVNKEDYKSVRANLMNYFGDSLSIPDNELYFDLNVKPQYLIGSSLVICDVRHWDYVIEYKGSNDADIR